MKVKKKRKKPNQKENVKECVDKRFLWGRNFQDYKSRLFSYYCQVREKEQFVQQLKEDIEKEENNYKPQDNLQLCQVSHKCPYSVKHIQVYL